MAYKKLKKEALKVIDRLSSEKRFKLKDLFRGVDWKELSRKKRRDFGRYFKDLVDSGQIKDVVYERTESDNHKVYRKL